MWLVMAVTKGKADTGRTYFSEPEIEKMILKAYPEPSYTVLFQVRDGTGFATRGREADAIVFGTWPSRGFQIIGFEIKSSRSDWKSELANPEKAESVGKYCDMWFVVGSEDVIKLEEVPPAWGWFIPTEKGLKDGKYPKPEIEPIPITKVFLMSLVRNLSKSYVRKSELDELVKAKSEERNTYELNRANSRVKDLEEKLKKLAEFEVASGISIDGPNGYHSSKEVGEVVNAVLNTSLSYNVKLIKDGAESCHDLLTKIAALPFFTERLNKL